jgi:N4-gp56 family major capsid protein
MSFSGTQYGDISPRVGIHAVAKFLAHAQNMLVLEKFAVNEPLPKNKGLTIKWRRAVPFDVVANALTEGVTPTPQILEYEDVSTTISQYGAWVPFTDVIQDTHEDPNLQKMTELCAQQAAAIKESIIWSALRAGTSVIYSGSATTRATVLAPLDENDLRLVQRELKGNHAMHITKMIGASDKISTEPVAPAFLAFSHTNLEQDLRDLTGFTVREKYASYQPVSDYEIGKFEDIRFILTPHLEPFFGAGSATTTGVLNTNSAVDVYPLIIVGADAYATTALKGMEAVNIAVKNPKMGDSYEDPLGQRGFVAWKMWYVATRLNESWMIRVECAVSAL